MKYTRKKAVHDGRQSIDASDVQDRQLPLAPEDSLDRTGRLRRRLVAIWLPVTALLYVSCEALDPKGSDEVITTTATALKLLHIAAKHTSQLYLSGSMSEIALAALAASYFGIATFVRRRGSTLATIAAIVGAVGAFCGVVANVFVGINLAAVSRAHLANLQAARFLTTSFNSSTAKIFFDFYAFSELLAPVIMFVALWRSRLIPRWLSVLFLVGFELAEQTPSAGPVRVVAMMALFVVAMALLAGRIWRSAGSRDSRIVEMSN